MTVSQTSSRTSSRTSRPSRGRATAGSAATAPEPAATGRTTEQRGTAEQSTDGHALTLNLPMLTVQLRPPHMHLPHINRQEAGHAVDTARSLLPPPERLVYYGGLGALAVAGLIEWPVAAAIGVGTVIAQRARRERAAAPPVPASGPGSVSTPAEGAGTTGTAGTTRTRATRATGGTARATGGTARTTRATRATSAAGGTARATRSTAAAAKAASPAAGAARAASPATRSASRTARAAGAEGASG
ncbi:hypothetical protein GCM10027187_11080 [Streptosporangium sandarakinum]|uniref:Uncharacterized protein n=1 Tax=Streptosporangium sandarakinum TaxID=1260955 RepID=A0A852UU86_9ACTN|nr:hypothetical protein [Streptosporangium sandarakinum]NYF39799.1 hypothetical protein [Streptosporangium sandarakinum]